MARYTSEYEGISGDPEHWTGADPNYRGRYGGMRMHGDERQAAYGWYRWRHPMELDPSGGFRGNNVGSGHYARGYDRGYGRGYDRPFRSGGRPGYDRDWEGGGVRDLRRDTKAMREFNANSPALRPEARQREDRYGGDFRRGGPRSHEIGGHHRGERFDYANRGLSDGGFSDGWAWGPMRGAR